jgi:hypothetical protein
VSGSMSTRYTLCVCVCCAPFKLCECVRAIVALNPKSCVCVRMLVGLACVCLYINKNANVISRKREI